MRENVKIEPLSLPTIYLAGPVRNAPKWQEEAIKLLLEENEEVFVASPTRVLSAELIQFVEKDDPSKYQTFERQRAWERYYLNGASQNGCIVFWLPKALEPKEFPNKQYAHITMMELGEWIARKKANKNINIILGTDGEFPEWSIIHYEILSEIPGVQIFSSIKNIIYTAFGLCSI